MRYRALSASGDMTFGASQANFLVNSPETVGQAVLTRLRLIRGEWFLDVTAGTPWAAEVLGVRTKPLYDRAIRDRITGTQGVVSINNYSSSLTGRTLRIDALNIDTIYGEVPLIWRGLGPDGTPVVVGKVGMLDFSDADQSGLMPAL